MSSRWFWLLYPGENKALDPVSGLASLSSIVSLDHPGLETLPPEFDPRLDNTISYEILPSANIDPVIHRMELGSHLRVCLRCESARVDLLVYHNSKNPIILFITSTHEPTDAHRAITTNILKFGFYSNAAYIVTIDESVDISNWSIFNNELLTKINQTKTKYGHGVHAVYVNHNFGGVDIVIPNAAAPVLAEMGYYQYIIPGSFTE